jgi:deazaflavin-dependent oxidoreductase (nitroreductase family)
VTDYIPTSIDWVREQIELYERSGGTEGTTLRDTGLPCVIITHTGRKTGATRKTALMRVKVDDCYVLVGSNGGSPKDPVWVSNFRAKPDVEIRDKAELFKMRLREVHDDEERGRLWQAAREAFPPYDEYQAKTPRRIPVFIAEPA